KAGLESHRDRSVPSPPRHADTAKTVLGSTKPSRSQITLTAVMHQERINHPEASMPMKPAARTASTSTMASSSSVASSSSSSSSTSVSSTISEWLKVKPPATHVASKSLIEDIDDEDVVILHRGAA